MKQLINSKCCPFICQQVNFRIIFYVFVLSDFCRDFSIDRFPTNRTELGTFRGGCIICMDYGNYAAESYVRLVRLFEPIVQILTLELLLLEYIGFDMSKGYMFGFSYGGQLATEAGRRIGHQRLKDIDSERVHQSYFV